MSKKKNHHAHADEPADPLPVDEPVVDEQEAPETQVVPPYPMGVAVLRCQKQRHRDHVTAGGISIYT
jgi:hypothetical protein